MLCNMTVAIVLVHAAILAFHGTAHVRLGIDAPGWHGPFIVLVIIVTPLVAAVLLLRKAACPAEASRGRERAGFALLAASMVGSLAFGVMFHFVLPGPDNVMEVRHHSWAHTFRLSAALLAVSEAAAVGVAAVGLVRAPRGSS